MMTEEAEAQAEKIFNDNGLDVICPIDGKPTLAVKQVARAIHAAYLKGYDIGHDDCGEQIKQIIGA